MIRNLIQTLESRRNRKPWLVAIPAVALAIALLLCPSPPCSAAGPAPDGPAVLARYAEAVGGVAAWDSIRNSVSQVVLEIQGTNMRMNVTEFRGRPNFQYVMLDLPDGKVLSGVYKGYAWESSVAAGPRLLDGQEQADAVREASFDQLVHWRAAYRTAEVTGADTVEGHPCHKVVMKPRLGAPQTMYFDVDSGLLWRVDATFETTQMGTVNTKGVLSDYRKVGGVLVAHKQVTDVLGQRRIGTIVEQQFNADLPADRFDPPVKVMELLKAKEQ